MFRLISLAQLFSPKKFTSFQLWRTFLRIHAWNQLGVHLQSLLWRVWPDHCSELTIWRTGKIFSCSLYWPRISRRYLAELPRRNLRKTHNRKLINPLHLNISMHILPSVPYTFLYVIVNSSFNFNALPSKRVLRTLIQTSQEKLNKTILRGTLLRWIKTQRTYLKHNNYTDDQ